MKLLLLLSLTLGVVVADAWKLLYEVQQKDQLPPEDGLLRPDQASKCSNTATCCQLSSGKWGCCPFARATCCGDNVYCCPNGYSCHMANEPCVRAINNDTMPWAKKEDASAVSAQSSDEAIGPKNRGFETEKWETVSASTPALLPSESTPAAEKLPANVVGASGKEKTTLGSLKVVWCDSAHNCTDGYTCCRLPDAIWGCCPLAFATCCIGNKYCCPRGKRCSNPPGHCY